MKKLNALLVCACLAIFTVGCGAGGGPSTADEQQKIESDMAADMENMTGQISEKGPTAEEAASEDK